MTERRPVSNTSKFTYVAANSRKQSSRHAHCPRTGNPEMRALEIQVSTEADVTTLFGLVDCRDVVGDNRSTLLISSEIAEG